MPLALRVPLPPREAYNLLLEKLASWKASLLIAREPELLVVKRALLMGEENVPSWLKATITIQIQGLNGDSTVSISVSRSWAEKVLPIVGIIASAFILVSWRLGWMSFDHAMEASEDSKRKCFRELAGVLIGSGAIPKRSRRAVVPSSNHPADQEIRPGAHYL